MADNNVENIAENDHHGPVIKIINEGAKTGVLATPEDFTSPDDIYQILLEKIKEYHPSDDFSLIEKAYKIADDAHKHQKRKSGEPYIIHPLKATLFLMELKPDLVSIQACIMHDVIEDTPITREEIAAEFSEEVAEICEGLVKVSKVRYQ